MALPLFKPFEAADVAAVLRMMQDFYAIDNYPIDAAVSYDLLLQFIDNSTLGHGWVIIINGQPVGYAILTLVFSFEYAGRIAFLDELYIVPSARAQGLGKATLNFIKEQAETLSVKLIYLEVEPHNKAAQKLYISSGFDLHKRNLMRLKP